jgi:hypothetical protein
MGGGPPSASPSPSATTFLYIFESHSVSSYGGVGVWPLGSLLAALVAAITAVVAVPWAQNRWDKVKKQRELDLTAVGEFHAFYGEFLDLRKLWARHSDQTRPSLWCQLNLHGSA